MATNRRLKALALSAAGIAATIAVWWGILRVIPMPEQFAQGFSPAGAWSGLVDMVRNGDLIRHTLPSLQRVGIGLLFAFAVGVPVGVAVGHLATVRHLTNTTFQFLRMISPLAWMPVAIIMFGVGDRPVYFLIAVAAVWPIVINTAQGVRGMEPGWTRVIKTLGGSRTDVLLRAVLPAVVPDIITGLRISIGISWVILVPAEMLGVSSGLGYFILDTRDRFAYGELMAAILSIGFIGLVLDNALGYLENRLSWKVSPMGES